MLSPQSKWVTAAISLFKQLIYETFQLALPETQIIDILPFNLCIGCHEKLFPEEKKLFHKFEIVNCDAKPVN